MASKRQRADAAKKKEKRTKIIAIVGCVLLVAIGAYEIPSMLAVMNKKPPNTTYDPGPSTVSGALPNVAAGAAAAAPAAGDLASAGGPTAAPGQLVSFDVFEAKNPFAPQVSEAAPDVAATSATTSERPGADVPTRSTPTTATAGATASSAGAATRPAGAVTPSPSATPTLPAPTSSGAATPTTTTATTTTTTPVQATVAVKVNDVVSRVASGGTFPSGAPVFRLVSFTKTAAQIAIVGGSYSTGDPTLTVKVGEPVTLENQTTGKRYTIELLSTG